MDTSTFLHDQNQPFPKKLSDRVVSVPSLLSLSLKDNNDISNCALSMKPPLQYTEQPLPHSPMPGASIPSCFGEGRSLSNHHQGQTHTFGTDVTNGTGIPSPHRSPSLHNGSGSLASLQAVPEDAELDAVEVLPNICESPFSSVQTLRRLSTSSLSDVGSEDTANSPILNINVQGHEIPNSLLVALRDRAVEMRELYERNAPFFDQVTSCVLSSIHHAQPSTKQNRTNSSPTTANSESPLDGFLDLLFAPREQVPDRVWMQSVEGYLSGSPALLETFRELVGYEPEDQDYPLDCDDLDVSGMPWLPGCDDDEDSETEEDEDISAEEVQWKNGLVGEFIDIESNCDTGDLKKFGSQQEPDFLKSAGIAI